LLHHPISYTTRKTIDGHKFQIVLLVRLSIFGYWQGKGRKGEGEDDVIWRVREKEIFCNISL